MRKDFSPRILHISTYDHFGGAAKAATRILQCQTAAGMNASMMVMVRQRDIKEIYTPHKMNPVDNLRFARELIHVNQQNRNSVAFHSSGSVSANILSEINESDCDVVHLHWINNMLSVEEIGAIRKPVVWTFHDMWPFCGKEHYVDDIGSTPFCNPAEGLTMSVAIPDQESYRVWRRKIECWSGLNMTIITPSHWLESQTRNSFLFHETPVFTIPLPVDSQHDWFPEKRDVLRKKFDVPDDRKIILCIAQDLLKNPRKGLDLLDKALQSLVSFSDRDRYELFIVGTDAPKERKPFPLRVRWLGDVSGAESLRQILSLADVLTVPSRMEVFSLTTLEAQACGLPVVAFDRSGPAEIIRHRKTGWLSQSFDIKNFAEGIQWITEDRERWKKCSEESRINAITRFSPSIIAEKYRDVYLKIMTKQEPGSMVMFPG